MSIATEEAVRIYPLKGHSDEAYERCMVSRVDYVRGRTAPVTEEEIEAAARELWRDAFYRRARPSGTVQDFDDLTEKDRQHLTHAAQAMLSAARKQVNQ